jgi:hypothetical protein
VLFAAGIEPKGSEFNSVVSPLLGIKTDCLHAEHLKDFPDIDALA